MRQYQVQPPRFSCPPVVPLGSSSPSLLGPSTLDTTSTCSRDTTTTSRDNNMVVVETEANKTMSLQEKIKLFESQSPSTPTRVPSNRRASTGNMSMLSSYKALAATRAIPLSLLPSSNTNITTKTTTPSWVTPSSARTSTSGKAINSTTHTTPITAVIQRDSAKIVPAQRTPVADQMMNSDPQHKTFGAATCSGDSGSTGAAGAVTADDSRNSSSSNTSKAQHPEPSFSRMSLVERARQFDPNYIPSPVRRKSRIKTIEELLQLSQHRKEVMIRTTKPYNTTTNNNKNDINRTFQEWLTNQRKKHKPNQPSNVKVNTANSQDESRKSSSTNRGKQQNATKPHQFPAGPNMQALLDSSEHAKSTMPTPPPPPQFTNVRAPALPASVDLTTYQPPIHHKTAYQLALIRKAIVNKTFILKNHRSDTQEKIARAMEGPLRMHQGQVLQQQGEINSRDDDQHLYVVEGGNFQEEVDGQVVQNLSSGDTIGQTRLLHKTRNKSTIRATEDSRVFRIHQTIFRTIMQQQHQCIMEELLATKKRADAAKSMERQATCTAPKSVCEDLDQEDQHVGNLETNQIDNDKPMSPDKADAYFRMDNAILQKQDAIRESVAKNVPTKSDLELIKVLGSGHYGDVWLVSANLADLAPFVLTEPRQEFALKVQTSDPEINQEAFETIKLEIQILQQLHHPFIVNLVHSYQSDESMDMLLQLIPGGELWNEIHKEDDSGNWISGISEDRAKFYAFAMTDALSYIHSCGYIFRDLKPENVMIDDRGYPILIDFGFAKQLAPGEKTFTFCGTPNYIAPEIITSFGHGHEVDYWALGIVIYEMVAGMNPFWYEGIDHGALYEAISDEAPYEIPSDRHASSDVLDLVSLLLEKNPPDRLGAHGACEVLEHVWFKGMPNMEDMRAKNISPNSLVASEKAEGPIIEEWSLEDKDKGHLVFEDCEDDWSHEEDASYNEIASFAHISIDTYGSESFRKLSCNDQFPKEARNIIKVDENNESMGEAKGLWGNSFTSPIAVDSDYFCKEDTHAGGKPNGILEPKFDPAIPTSVVTLFPERKTTGRGYYINMKSPEEKRDSRARRSMVMNFVAEYVDDLDL